MYLIIKKLLFWMEENNMDNAESPEENKKKKQNLEILNLPLDKKKEIIESHIVKLPIKIQKVLHKLTYFFYETIEKGHNFISKSQLEQIFPEQYKKIFNKAITLLIEMSVLGYIDFCEFVIDDTGICSLLENTAYTLVLKYDSIKKIPQKALKQSLIKVISLKSRLFHNPKETLFSLGEVTNPELINKNVLDATLKSVLTSKNIVSLSYYYLKGSKISKENGYFIKKYALELLNTIGEKYNKIYVSREQKVKDAISKTYNYIILPDTGFKDTFVFSPMEIFYISKHIIDFVETYGQTYQIIGERALLLYEEIPKNIIEKIEADKESKKENLILNDIAMSASKFFDNYRDIIDETSLIDILVQLSSKDKKLIIKSIPRFSNRIRKASYIEKDKQENYYASINNLIFIMKSVKNISIKLEYIKLEVVVSMLEELFEMVNFSKMDVTSLCSLLNINTNKYESIKREVSVARKTLSETFKVPKTEKKIGFFERLFAFFFGKGQQKGKSKNQLIDKSKTPEQKERELYNKKIKEIINYFSYFKRPQEIKKFPKEIKNFFNNSEEELRNFLNKLVGEQVLRKVKVDSKRIGYIEYYLPFSFFSNPKKFDEMVQLIKARVTLVDLKEILLEVLMKDYSTIQGKIKK